MQGRMEAERKAIWSEVPEPAQRGLLALAGLTGRLIAPLRLDLSGPNEYVGTVAEVLETKLSDQAQKPEGEKPKPMPIRGLKRMTEIFSDIPDSREAILVIGRRSNSQAGYDTALARLVIAANEELRLRGVAPLIPDLLKTRSNTEETEPKDVELKNSA